AVRKLREDFGVVAVDDEVRAVRSPKGSCHRVQSPLAAAAMAGFRVPLLRTAAPCVRRSHQLRTGDAAIRREHAITSTTLIQERLNGEERGGARGSSRR